MSPVLVLDFTTPLAIVVGAFLALAAINAVAVVCSLLWALFCGARYLLGYRTKSQLLDERIDALFAGRE